MAYLVHCLRLISLVVLVLLLSHATATSENLSLNRLTYDPEDSITPSVAVGPDGSSHVVWKDASDGTIYYMRVNRHGEILVDKRAIYDIMPGSLPKIAVDSNNCAHVVCQIGSTVGIIYVKVDSAGNRQLHNLLYVLDPGVTDDSYFTPDISIDPSSNLPVAIFERDFKLAPYYYNTIVAVRMNADGEIVEHMELYWLKNYGYPIYRSSFPAIAADGSGRIHAVWLYDDNGSYHVACSNSDSTAWWTLSNEPVELCWPVIDLGVSRDDGQDRVNVAWNRATEIYWTQLDQYGVTVVDDFVVVGSGAGKPQSMSLDMASSAEVYFAWADERDGDAEIYRKVCTPGDSETEWSCGSDERLTENPGSSRKPSTEVHGDLCVAQPQDCWNSSNIVWQDDSYDANYEVFIAQWEPTYSISGHVEDRDGAPISEVAVSAGVGGSAITDMSGAYTITGVISGTYTLTPTLDAYTFSPPTRTVTVPPDATGQDFVGTALDLWVDHIEVVQLLLTDAVPLIAEKPSLVRVYIGLSGAASVPDVSAHLYVQDAQGQVQVVEGPYNGPTIIARQEPDPHTLNDTLNFLPQTSWLTGTVTFWAEVDPEDVISEGEEGNNTGGNVARSFEPGQKLRIAWVAIPYAPPNSSGSVVHPDGTVAAMGSRFLRQIYPLGSSDVDYFQQPTQRLRVMRRPFSGENGTEFYLPALNRFWNLTTQRNAWVGGRSPDRLYGWVPEEAKSDICGIADARFIGRRGRVAAGLAIPQCGDETVAHELGHLLNEQELRHAPCGGATGTDPNYPHPGGSIGDWGLKLQPKADLLPPDKAYDFMSYCWPPWVSAYNYNKLAQGFAPTAVQQQAMALSSPERHLLASGIVHTPALTVTFDTFYPLTSTVPPDTDSGTAYCLELRDPTESILARRCFDLDFINPETGEAMGAEAFTLVLPYPVGTQSVVLSNRATELGRVTASASAPTVQLTSPNGGEFWEASGTFAVTWIASDADDDQLRFIVSYSPDAGITWMPMALDVATSHLAVDGWNLPGSTEALFKVEASDQLHVAEDISDSTLAVAPKEPQAYILSPEGSVSIRPGMPLWLDGYGYDLEDGSLQQTALRWRSSRDGELGTGNQLLVTLSLGYHVVTLTATDSSGDVGEARVEVFVMHKVYLPLVLQNHF
jgi:hypothetical protein